MWLWRIKLPSYNDNGAIPGNMTMKVAPQYLETQFKLPLLLCTPKTKILVKEGLKKTEKNGTKFSQIVLIRLSLTAFTQFFWTLPLQCKGVAKVERPNFLWIWIQHLINFASLAAAGQYFFNFFCTYFFTNGQLKEQYQQRGAFLGVETQHLIYGDNGAAAEVDKK